MSGAKQFLSSVVFSCVRGVLARKTYPDAAIAAMDEAPSLDEWYSSAGGTADEPFDPSPEEDDFFINDAEPTIDLDSDDEDDPEIF